MLKDITKEMFRESLNTRFGLRADEASEPVELELVELTEGVSSPKHEQYSLLFRGPQSPYFPQKIYRLEHDKLGTLELFLVPIGQNTDGFNYEAIISRLLKTD